ncbi:MAG: hypothetical protein ABI216_08785 [Devosia sp.]
MKFILALALLGTFEASAVGASNGPQQSHPLRGLHMAPGISKISESDCRAFGGKFVKVLGTICPSGNSCETTDINNNKHSVCVEKAVNP